MTDKDVQNEGFLEKASSQKQRLPPSTTDADVQKVMDKHKIGLFGAKRLQALENALIDMKQVCKEKFLEEGVIAGENSVNKQAEIVIATLKKERDELKAIKDGLVETMNIAAARIREAENRACCFESALKHKTAENEKLTKENKELKEDESMRLDGNKYVAVSEIKKKAKADGRRETLNEIEGLVKRLSAFANDYRSHDFFLALETVLTILQTLKNQKFTPPKGEKV